MANGTGKGQPCSQCLQSRGNTIFTPKCLWCYYYHVRSPCNNESPDDNQDGYESFALVGWVNNPLESVPSAARGGRGGAGVLPPILLRVLLHNDNTPTVDFAGLNPGHTEYESVADHHDHERQQCAPDLPKGCVGNLLVPGCHTHPLELVKLQRGPAKKGREAANKGMQPHVHKSYHCSVARYLHRINHRVQHSIVPAGQENK